MRLGLFITCLLLSACGDKQETSTAAPAQAKGDSFGDYVPADDASQTFASSLVSTNFTDVEPVESLNWDAMTFNADGSWSARGAVSMADEKMECNEGGKWEMDAAERSDAATVTWHLDETNCAGRSSGSQQRVHLTLRRDGSYEMLYR